MTLTGRIVSGSHGPGPRPRYSSHPLGTTDTMECRVRREWRDPTVRRTAGLHVVHDVGRFEASIPTEVDLRFHTRSLDPYFVSRRYPRPSGDSGVYHLGGHTKVESSRLSCVEVGHSRNLTDKGRFGSPSLTGLDTSVLVTGSPIPSTIVWFDSRWVTQIIPVYRCGFKRHPLSFRKETSRGSFFLVRRLRVQNWRV